MDTLTYGLQAPENGDRGDVVFPAMVENIEQLDGHSHDGINSKKLDRKSVDAILQTVSNAGWVDQGGGTYRQEVTMPAGLTFDAIGIGVRLSTGEPVNLSIEKTAGTKFYVYINDNSKSLKIIYG